MYFFVVVSIGIIIVSRDQYQLNIFALCFTNSLTNSVTNSLIQLSFYENMKLIRSIGLGAFLVYSEVL